jgi:single-strand DNA-binding protein
MNVCIFVGNLTADVQTTQVKSKDGEIAKGTIKLAINNNENSTTYLDIAVWGKSAENAAKYLKKGQAISVNCFVENNNYERQDGQKVYSLQFTARDWQFINSTAKTNNN